MTAFAIPDPFETPEGSDCPSCGGEWCHSPSCPENPDPEDVDLDDGGEDELSRDMGPRSSPRPTNR